jgi:hypothetical protein
LQWPSGENQGLLRPFLTISAGLEGESVGRREQRALREEAMVRRLEAFDEEEAVRREARARDLVLRVQATTMGPVPTMHWMFDQIDTGRRILNYWPGSGTCQKGINGPAFKAKGHWEALDLATEFYLKGH